MQQLHADRAVLTSVCPRGVAAFGGLDMVSLLVDAPPVWQRYMLLVWHIPPDGAAARAGEAIGVLRRTRVTPLQANLHGPVPLRAHPPQYPRVWQVGQELPRRPHRHRRLHVDHAQILMRTDVELQLESRHDHLALERAVAVRVTVVRGVDRIGSPLTWIVGGCQGSRAI